MEECFVCGVKKSEKPLFDAIGENGVIKVCKDCSIKEDLTIIKKPSNFQLSQADKKRSSVYEKLTKMSGVDHREKNLDAVPRKTANEKEIEKYAKNKDKLMFPNLNSVDVEQKEDLIRNYHWAILNARRARRLSKEKVSREIGESKETLKRIERGLLPKDYRSIISKLQTYLGITLFKKPQKEKKIGFDSATTKDLKIEDLKRKTKNKNTSSYWKRRLSFLKKKKKVPEEENFEEGLTLERDLDQEENL